MQIKLQITNNLVKSGIKALSTNQVMNMNYKKSSTFTVKRTTIRIKHSRQMKRRRRQRRYNTHIHTTPFKRSQPMKSLDATVRNLSRIVCKNGKKVWHRFYMYLYVSLRKNEDLNVMFVCNVLMM